MNTATRSLALTALALSAAIGTAQAQPATPPKGPTMHEGERREKGRGDDARGPMMEMMRGMRSEHAEMGMGFTHVEGRIAYLKAELAITEAQGPAWSEFANLMRSNATAMRKLEDDTAKSTTPLTTPDRMAARHTAMTARLAMMERSQTGVTAIYAALTPEQRKTFDQMMRGPMGMM